MFKPTHRKNRRSTPTSPIADANQPFAAFEELESKLLMSTYYLATNGSDSAAGNLTAPFASLKKFFSIAKPGDTVYLRGGTYDASTSAWRTIYPNVSGTASAPITVSGMPGEKVVIDHQYPGYDSFIYLTGGESYLNFQNMTVKNYLVDFNMQGGTPNHITLSNLDLGYCDVYGSTPDGRAIRMRGADNITVKNVDIHDVGGVGIAGIGHNTNITFDNLSIHHINDGRPGNTDADGINFTYGDGSYSSGITVNNTRVWDVTSDGLDIKGDNVTETNDSVWNVGSVAYKLWSPFDGASIAAQGHFTLENDVGWGAGVATLKCFSLPVVSIQNSTFIGNGVGTEAAVSYKNPAGGETWKGSLNIQNTVMQHMDGSPALLADKWSDTSFNLQGNTYYSTGKTVADIYTSSSTDQTFTAADMTSGKFTSAIGVETAAKTQPVDIAPQIGMATGTQPLAAGQSASFNAVAADPKNTPITYSWAFGDGGTATGATASHTYASNGTYNATLTATDSAGSKTMPVTMVVGTGGGTTITPPVAQNQSLSGQENTPITGTATATDANNYPLSYSLATQASHGTATVGTSGQFTYTPAAKWYGQDSFAFGVSDGKGGAATGTITLNVQAPPVQPPVATNDTASTKDTQPVIINVLANDSDPQSYPLTVTSTTTPTHGSVAINSDGTLTYTPAAPYTGSDAFQYTISDGKATATATVTVACTQTPITPPPATPPASTGTFTGADIGSPALAGSTSYNATAGTYTVTGAGANIWDAADQFQYAYQEMTGDGQIVARIDSMTSPHHFAKAGLMMRNSLDAGSAQVMAALTGSEGTGTYYRTTDGGISANILMGDTTQRAPMWLKLVRQGSTFTSYKSADGANWTPIGTATVAMGQTIYVGMAVGSHVTTATASATFSHVALNGQVSDPATLNLQDIGSPALAGSTQYNPTTGTYTISGSGANIWDASDQLRYASQSMTGDGTIIARVSSMNSTRSFAKAGLMIRDSADPGAAQVMVTLLGTQGTGLYYRSATGGTSANILTGDLTQQAPVWLKLVRSGNTFTGYKSSDGVNWTSLGSTTVQMGSTVQVGLAVCSHDISSLATAQFDNVQLS